MIVVAAPAPEEPRQPTMRILNIVTIDENDQRRWWSPKRLMREHPELFNL